MPYGATVEPLWLTMAGSAGSALGGLTVFGAAIGFLLTQRKSRRDARLHMSALLDRVVKAVDTIQAPLADVRLNTFESAKAIQAELHHHFYDEIGTLDLQAMNEPMRKIGRLVDGMIGSLRSYIMLVQIPDKRAEAVEHQRRVSIYLIGVAALLKRKRGNPVKKLKAIQPETDWWKATMYVTDSQIAYEDSRRANGDPAVRGSGPDPRRNLVGRVVGCHMLHTWVSGLRWLAQRLVRSGC